MARRRGRGGYQRPSQPAAVSPPGALSQRTDGARPEFSGLDYGENIAVNEQMRAAPMRPPRGQAPPPQQGRRRGGPPEFGARGIFSPSDRPAEPLTAGVDFGPGQGAPPRAGLPADETRMIRAVIAEYPELADNLIHLVEGG